MKIKLGGPYYGGWIPDHPDHRDLLYSVPAPGFVPPRKVDLSHLCPPIFDQGELGSCTAQALSGAMTTLMQKNRGDSGIFSRLFIYYDERELEGTISDDSGAMIRDGLNTLRDKGACFEINWPYDVAEFKTRPPDACYRQAELYQITSYKRLDPQSLPGLLHCLADGYTFVGGVSVYDSFVSRDTAKSGIIPMPRWSERMLGGHALHFVGYDLATRRFKGANSWGKRWGAAGFFEMPFEYVAHYGDDFWTIRAAEGI